MCLWLFINNTILTYVPTSAINIGFVVLPSQINPGTILTDLTIVVFSAVALHIWKTLYSSIFCNLVLEIAVHP